MSGDNLAYINTETVVENENADNNPQKIVKEETNKKKKYITLFIKRVTDIIVGLIGTLALVPLTLIIWIIKKINKENGPVFYEQIRIGKNGKYFKLFKYRSMVIGADKILHEYLKEHPEEAEEFKKYRKLENDPRITKMGKFLRETSLDEFPQFLNLLNGTMSLIGPRPIVDGEIDAYGENREKFLSVKPGLTGYWQANGRSNTTYEERMEMELYYVDNMSIWLDIKIFFKTFSAIFRKEGAK